VPIEPPPSRWELPDPAAAPSGEDLIGVGADLEPGTLLEAYRSGLFPMPLGPAGPTGWFSPDPRGIIPLDGLRVSRSLRRSCRRFEVRIDTAFAEVIRACADPSRAGTWITPAVEAAYGELHRLGWAHSVETWSGGELVGGCYGVAIGGFFAGESMFHRVPDASKVALVALVEHLRGGGATLLDVQWVTPHLASLGAVALDRPTYLRRLRSSLRRPGPVWVASG
jgi:leucyl/phenylalanyl-tRNA--protein transferase